MDEPWFEHKRYGVGASWPCHWKGWALTGGFVTGLAVIAIVANRMLPTVPALIVTVLGDLALAGAFVWLASRKTRGGWRWRWGDKERPPHS